MTETLFDKNAFETNDDPASTNKTQMPSPIGPSIRWNELYILYDTRAKKMPKSSISSQAQELIIKGESQSIRAEPVVSCLVTGTGWDLRIYGLKQCISTAGNFVRCPRAWSRLGIRVAVA